ncbi:MAG: HAMP domain-containing protein, partial [Bacteroidota bacterium]
VGLDSVYFSNVFFQNDTSQNVIDPDGYRKNMFVSAPVYGGDNLAKGVIIFDIDLRYVYDLVADSIGLGKTGEIRLAKDFDNSILFLNPARGEDFSLFIRSRNQPIRKDRNLPAQEAAKGLDGMAYARDGNGDEVLASWSFIPMVNWGMVVQIKKSEIENEKFVFVRYLLISLGVIALILLFFALSFSRLMVQAIMRLKEVVNLLSQGILSERITVNGRDEIGDMAYKLNVVVDNLQNTADFARKIGQGEFEAEFRPVGDQDNLGTALLTMRDSIQQSVQRDDERNWIVTGLAEIGDILPSITTIDELGDLVSEYVTNKISAVQGAFYTVNDEDEENPQIVLQSTYAYNKKKYIQSR